MLDPYLVTTDSNNSISTDTVRSAYDTAFGGTTSNAIASGIVADQTSTAIAIYGIFEAVPVTFTVTNGATLAKYDPAFLTKAPASGSSTYTVPVTDLIRSDYPDLAQYLAIVLVQAGSPPSMSPSAALNVTASNAGHVPSTATVPLDVYQPPVVLVHGLWSDGSGLSNVATYLKGKLNGASQNSWMVQSICYSKNIAFDAETDPLPASTDGCEITSADSLDFYYATKLHKQLNSVHIVGGRADVVAHSMGGLVARHYADISNSNYKNIRNRFQGAFDKVITIDTPHNGSQLGYWLNITGATRREQQPSLVWSGACLSVSIDLQDCLAKKGEQLTGPGLTLKQGAVWSIVPPSDLSGTSIGRLPSVSSLNGKYSKWYAIVSDWYDDGSTRSLMRMILNNLLSATYLTSQSPYPTLTSILNNSGGNANNKGDNDVIVTAASQQYQVPSAQVYVLPAGSYLAHSSILKTTTFNLQELPPSYAALSDDSVITACSANPAACNVDKKIVSWLSGQTASASLPEDEQTMESAQPVPPRRQEHTQDEIEAFRKTSGFFVKDRVSIPPIEKIAELGQPFRITVKLSGQKVFDMGASQIDEFGHGAHNQDVDGKDISTIRIVERGDREMILEIVPLWIGNTRIDLSTRFVDGGMETESFILKVIPSEKGLKYFRLVQWGGPLGLVLDSKKETFRAHYLSPELMYEQMENPIQLTNSRGLELTIEQPEDDPIIEVDKDGMVKALRPGNATIYSRIGNFKSEPLKVIVTTVEEERKHGNNIP